MKSFFFLLLSHYCITGFHIKSSIRVPSYSSSSSQLSSTQNGNIWAVRRKLIRTCFLDEAKKRATEPEKSEEDSLLEMEKNKDASFKLTLGVSAFFIAIGATVFRFGGRAAFVQLLGLDFMTNGDMKGQVDALIGSFNDLGDLKYLAFLAAWIVAKCVCIDFFTLVLALSSGILFGGIGEGALASVASSSIASSVPFFLSRYKFRELAQIEINKRPTWRAVDKACSKDGFKTVFVLRLSPLLPIPIGMYNYLYGATSVSFLDFFLGLTLGSAKPYLLDSYLGVYGKSIMDGDNSQNDYLFAFVVFVLVLVGSFSTQIAQSAYDEVKKEVEAEKESKLASGSQDALVSSNRDTWEFMGLKVKPPQVILGVTTGLTDASRRVDTVIADEWDTLLQETKDGVADRVDSQVSWDGLVFPSSITLPRSPLVAGPESDSSSGVNYPGARCIKPYENRVPDESNVAEFTYESLVFGLCLASALIKGTVMGEKQVVSQEVVAK